MARPIGIPLSTGDAEPFVLEENRNDPEEEQVVFMLKPLTGEQRHRCNRALAAGWQGTNNDGTERFDTGAALDAYRLACEYALGGWKNLTDAEGTNMPFPTKGGGKRATQMLPTAVVTDLGEEILKRAAILGEQQGN